MKGNLEEAQLRLEADMLLGTTIKEMLINKIEVDFFSFYAPTAEISDMTFGEFIYVDSLFLLCSSAKEPGAFLNKLCAIIYREERKNYDERSSSDRRVELNEGLIGYWAEVWAGVDKGIKEFIQLNWGLIRKWIEGKYPNIFDGGGSGDNSGGWLKVRDALAEKVTDLERIDVCLAHDVLRKIDADIFADKNKPEK